jgi:hypothetical protein
MNARAKELSWLAIIIAFLVFSSTAIGGAGLDTYWPINPGEVKTFRYRNKTLTISVEADDYGWYSEDGEYHYPERPTRYRLKSNIRNSAEYYEARPDGVYLTTASINGGWIKVFLDPAVKIFDDNILLNGGVTKTSTRATQRYYGKYKARYTIRVRKAGTVTVPVGTFQDCRSFSVKVTATLRDGRQVSASAMTGVLAPGVGIIRKLVKPGVWADLVDISTSYPLE